MRVRGLVQAAVLALFLAALLASPALAAVSITRAELSGSKLRVEGQGATPHTGVTVNGDQASGTSDGSGNFRIEDSSFAAPADCKIVVSDGTTSATATLSGCTVSSSSPSLSGLTINPDEVIQGDSATGTVTLSSAAPSGGFVVDLTNDAPDIASIPPSVTVPAGSTSANFTVSTFPDSRCCSATIVGTVGGDWDTHKYAIITVYTEFHYNHGSIAIIPGGGSGQVTSSPAGIDCTITDGEGGSGTCWSFFPTGTVVKLEALAAPGYSFLGWKTNLPGCSDPSKVEVPRGNNVDCQPVFRLK
jgi:hypothetical protein